MFTRTLLSRFAAALALLAVLGASGALLVPAGCGGGDKKSSTKKKKKTPKKDEDRPADVADMDPAATERELVKDQFKGVYQEFYQGNVDLAALYKALLDAEKARDKFDDAQWEEFTVMVQGLNYARVDIAEWLLDRKRNEAMADPADVAKGKALIQEVADLLKPVDRSKLSSLKIGEQDADYPGFYDTAQQKIQLAFQELETTAALVARTPPAGEVDLLSLDENLWEKEGTVEMTLSGGEMVLEGKDGSARITSKHYFFKDFTLKMTFVINSGGFDAMVRCMPGKGSPFFAGFDQADLPAGEPYTLIVEMIGDTARFIDGDGNELGDPVTEDRAPAGGSFAIKLRGAGSSLMIRSLTVEAR